MPFFRRRRRFSATPRRSWRRGRMSGTLETRRQYAQADLRNGLVVSQPAGGMDPLNPSFLIQALTPWSNSPEGGFDRAWEIKGLIFNIQVFPDNHTNQGTPTNGLYSTGEIIQVFTRLACQFFVDQTDPAGAPSSLAATPFGPFVTTPPIANPAAAPADDEFMPTRVLKRKVGLVQTGSTPISTGTGASAYAIGLSNFQWSGILRKRISIASRQGLYLGFFGLPPLGDYPTNINDVGLVTYTNVVFYYRLAR